MFWTALAILGALLVTAECLLPRPLLEEGVSSQAPRQLRVKTGLLRRSVLVPDGEVWAPRCLPPSSERSLRSLSTCDYCETKGSWSKKDRCRECGAPRRP